jgi:hypothetical protein
MNQEHTSSWNEKFERCGRRCRDKERTEKSRNGEYIGGIIFSLIFLWIVNQVPNWDIPFIRSNYEVVLWALNLSLIVKIAGNGLMLLLGTRGIRYLSRMFMEAAGFISQLMLYYIYPFDFSHVQGLWWFDRVLPILLIIGMVVSAVKAVSNLWKLLFWRD